ncbi:MAG TPA: LysR family transcriptional regulator [Candidatus Acidoferrales bacterium]|nr:LysR family transcriptional regulator [Candidatus Acidoferrales bacterium]
MIDFTSRQLRAFLLVAQHRSFTRAAGLLFITPSGLSVLIKELENQLGVRLFDRTTRQVALTASGTELLMAVQRNLDELDRSLSRTARTKETLGPPLSVGAPPFWAAGGVAQAIKAFRPCRPELLLQVFDGDAATILGKVESGELDMGLGFFFKHVPGIRRILLFRFSLMVIRADPGHASSRPTASWASLRGERFVTLQPSLPMQQFIDRNLMKTGTSYQPSLVVNYLFTQIAMVEAGAGIAVVPSLALPECRNRGLLMSSLVNPTVHLDFYQIRKGGRKLSPVAEEFTAFLKNYIVEWAGKSGLV